MVKKFRSGDLVEHTEQPWGVMRVISENWDSDRARVLHPQGIYRVRHEKLKLARVVKKIPSKRRLKALYSISNRTHPIDRLVSNCPLRYGDISVLLRDIGERVRHNDARLYIGRYRDHNPDGRYIVDGINGIMTYYYGDKPCRLTTTRYDILFDHRYKAQNGKNKLDGAVRILRGRLSEIRHDIVMQTLAKH